MAVEQDPRFTHPIPISAGIVPFTPRCLDVDRLDREMKHDIEVDLERLNAEKLDLARQVDENLLTVEQAATEDEILAAKIALVPKRREEAARQIEHLRGMVKTHPVFMVKIPTAIERDKVQGRLRELGLVTIGLDRVRGEMIESLYEHTWQDADGNDLTGAANDAVADEHADFLDGVWQRTAIHDELLRVWQEQEIERQQDRRAGALRITKSPAPPSVITPRERARQAMLIDKLSTASPRMRNIARLQADFEAENRIVLVRMNLVETRGLSVEVAISPFDHAISVEDAEAVRQALCTDFGDKLGDAAWNELVSYIDSSYSLDGFEEKNSDSPLGMLSAPSGSSEASGDTLTSGGSLTETELSSEPVPAAESDEITSRPSASTGASDTPKETARNDTPTDEG